MELAQAVPLGVALIALFGSIYAVRDAQAARRYQAEVAVIQRVLDSLDAAYIAMQPIDEASSRDVSALIQSRFNAIVQVGDRWGYRFESEALIQGKPSLGSRRCEGVCAQRRRRWEL